jgi:hypothetical protein
MLSASRQWITVCVLSAFLFLNNVIACAVEISGEFYVRSTIVWLLGLQQQNGYPTKVIQDGWYRPVFSVERDTPVPRIGQKYHIQNHNKW